MKHIHILRAAPLAALIALSACQKQEPEVVGGMYDPQADAANQLAPIEEMPPMERASMIYRCADNSVVYVTFFTDDAQVAVRTEQNGQQTFLPNPAAEAPADGNQAAPAEGGAPTFTDGSMTVIGTGQTIQFNGQSCRA